MRHGVNLKEADTCVTRIKAQSKHGSVTGMDVKWLSLESSQCDFGSWFALVDDQYKFTLRSRPHDRCYYDKQDI